MVFYDQGSLRAGARHGAGAHGHQTSHTGFRPSPLGRSWSFPFSILYLSPATFRRCAGSFDETCSGAARKKQQRLGGVTQEAEVPPQGLLRDRGLSAPRSHRQGLLGQGTSTRHPGPRMGSRGLRDHNAPKAVGSQCGPWTRAVQTLGRLSVWGKDRTDFLLPGHTSPL